MEQMIDNTGIHCCAIDPKGDLANVDMPLQQPHLVERLNSFAIQPKGYKIKTLYPYFMDLKYVKGSPFCLGMKNIKQLNNKAQVVDVLSNILDVGTRDENPAKEILNNLVYSLGDATKDVEPNSLETLPDKVLSNTEDSFLRRVLYHTTERAKSLGRAQKSISLKLMNQTVSAIKQLKLSDQINYDFPKELVNNEILVIRSVIEKDKSGDSAYIATVLSNIVSNRTLWLDSKGREGIISKPVVVYIDETDTLCGTDKSPSQEIIQRITTKYRRIGISLVLATQSPQMIDKGVLRETECIMSSRFNSEEERKAFANKGVSLRKISEMAMKLHFDKNNPVKEFIKVNEQGELETFFPTPSKSAIIQQSEI